MESKITKKLSRWRQATPQQGRDTGMAMVLLCLLVAYFKDYPPLIPAAIILLITTMAWPHLFRPLSVLWFGLSRFLGAVVSRLILSLLFFLLVTPIGLIRRVMGADSLQMKKWKRGTGSVFKNRSDTIKPVDLVNPY